jgi:hypothetical protein
MLTIFSELLDFRICLLSDILKTRETKASLYQWSRLALSKGPNIAPEDGNRSSFRNVVFSSFVEYRTMKKGQNSVIPGVIRHQHNLYNLPIFLLWVSVLLCFLKLMWEKYSWQIVERRIRFGRALQWTGTGYRQVVPELMKHHIMTMCGRLEA